MDFPNKPMNININGLSVIKTLLILLLFYFLFLIKEILAVLFISLVLASAIDPMVDWMQKKRIPRALGVIFIYLVMLGVVVSVVFLIIPPIAKEIKSLSDDFPRYMEKLSWIFVTIRDYSTQHGLIEAGGGDISTLSSNIQGAIKSIFSTAVNIFGGLFSFMLVLVMTFYMTVEENAIKKLIWSVAPERHQPYIMHLVNRMQRKIGLWLRGQLILCLIIFILIYAGLSILGVKYALVLALIAGLTEAVPYLGPMIAVIPAIFLSLVQSPLLALFVAGLYYITQLVENNILVPKIMQKAVGLNPIISITSLLIGFKIGGFIGAIISIPVATAVSVFVRDIFESREAAKQGGESVPEK